MRFLPTVGMAKTSPPLLSGRKREGHSYRIFAMLMISENTPAAVTLAPAP